MSFDLKTDLKKKRKETNSMVFDGEFFKNLYLEFFLFKPY